MQMVVSPLFPWKHNFKGLSHQFEFVYKQCDRIELWQTGRVWASRPAQENVRSKKCEEENE